MFRVIRSILCWFLLIAGMMFLIACVSNLAAVDWDVTKYHSPDMIKMGGELIDETFFGNYMVCSGIMLLGFVINAGVEQHYDSVGVYIFVIIVELIVAPFVATYLIIYKIISFIRWIRGH